MAGVRAPLAAVLLVLGCSAPCLGRSLEWYTALVNTAYTDPATNLTVLGSTESGRYGDSSPKESVQGLVGVPRAALAPEAPPEALEGCAADTEYYVPGAAAWPYPPGEGEEGVAGSWIALVARGGCTFKEKVFNAARRNAAAVVIYNEPKAGNATVSMSHIGQIQELKQMMSWHISLVCSAPLTGYSGTRLWLKVRKCREKKYPSRGTGSTVVIMVGYPKGMEIFEPVRSRIPVKMMITVGTRHVQEYISGQSVVFVAIAFITMMIISLAWLIFYYIQRFLYTGAQYGNQNNRKETKKAISQLQLHTVKRGEKGVDVDAENCAVCIENYKPKDVVRILPCKHIFHRVCIDPWLLEHRTCPMCKLDVIKALGFWVDAEDTLDIAVPDSMAGSVSAGSLSITQEDNRSEVNNLPSSSTEESVEHCNSPKEDAGETTALLDGDGTSSGHEDHVACIGSFSSH
ncbi:E3 ubiquitin-protein ligase RNF149 isoform X1 [Pleurodeles waltl]|uniref:E3 ubiquitin-protein ligase RNF149 isoform X1 n=1 Tax=Pleurodeles waltl TaxID=8319 RepID=UPI0037099D95